MRTELPLAGTDWNTLKIQLEDFKSGDVNWRDGRLGVYVFHAGMDVMNVGKDAYHLYQTENALGSAAAFPSLKKMETEVVDMGLSLLNAPEGACGNMTSGGSESIFMAVMCARNEASARGVDVVGAELLIPYSAHPAFDKAAGYLGLQVTRIALQGDHRADVAAMAAAISERTIMLVGSAPCYPYGLVDPIDALSELALERKLWLHVDACVGGYFLPHARANGGAVPAFDFTLPGVRSISADLHKYGFTPKAASTIFHRSEAQRAHQIFKFKDWPAGSMSTQTAAGSKPGGAIAGAWAVLNYLGAAGYRDKAAMIVSAQQQLSEGVAAIDGVEMLHEQRLAVSLIGSSELNVIALWQGMKQRGWFTSVITDPLALHLMVQPFHLQVMDELLSDLAATVIEVKAGANRATGEAPKYS